MNAADVAPWWTFFLLCARRQFKLLGRDTSLLQGRVAQVGGCCLFYGVGALAEGCFLLQGRLMQVSAPMGGV